MARRADTRRPRFILGRLIPTANFSLQGKEQRDKPNAPSYHGKPLLGHFLMLYSHYGRITTAARWLDTI